MARQCLRKLYRSIVNPSTNLQVNFITFNLNIVAARSRGPSGLQVALPRS